MNRPIVTDPNRFGGQPFIEGTSITIAEVQEYWRTPGVYAREIRARFPELSEAELGAAATYAPPQEPKFSYVADSEGPPRRCLRIWSEPPGWMFAVEEIEADGVERLGFDSWDETWERILLYPEGYAPKDVVWHDARSGEAVDIYALTHEDEP